MRRRHRDWRRRYQPCQRISQPVQGNRHAATVGAFRELRSIDAMTPGTGLRISVQQKTTPCQIRVLPMSTLRTIGTREERPPTTALSLVRGSPLNSALPPFDIARSVSPGTSSDSIPPRLAGFAKLHDSCLQKMSVFLMLRVHFGSKPRGNSVAEGDNRF